MPASHYEVLGVSPDSSSEAIQSAYRQQARLFHPDRHAGASAEVLEGATRSMTRLNEAWSVLSDPLKRADYDATLARRSNSRPLGDNGCAMCGSAPAVPISLETVTGLVVWFKRAYVSLNACKRCGTALVRSAANRTLLLGWWGPFAALANAWALCRIFVAWTKVASMPASAGASASGVPHSSPLPQGQPLIARSGPWVTAAALIALYVAASQLQFDVTESSATSAKAPVGACVNTGDMQFVRFVDCGASHEGVVIAMAKTAVACPETSTFTVLSKDATQVLCIRTTASE